MLEKKRLAIIDFGTNTFELIIAEPSDNGFTAIYQEKIGVFLGRDGIDKGLITEAAQKRAMDGVLKLLEQIHQHKVPNERMFGVATSVFRNAKNGAQLANSISEKTGIKIEIINGEAEAEYIFQGVRQGISLNEQNALVLDIGGGSVEFIIGNHRKVFWKRSFEIGGQRLKDQFMKSDPIQLLETQKLEIFLESQLFELSQAIFKYSPKLFIGSAGVFNTLAEMDYYRQNPGEELDRHFYQVNGYALSADDFYYLYYQITTLDRAARLLMPGMIELRVDMIVVAVCLVKFVLEKCELDCIYTSAFALKEGYLLHKLKSLG
jgi:exopolyphosphatase/guanosine-5'-triphosphate,3'-diphosphate pyrophosphatase